MFSAIGNIFWGRAEEEQTDSINNEETSNNYTEASTQTSDNKSASTQVNLDESKNNENPKNLNDTANSQQLDWVIVDDAEGMNNDKACSCGDENLVEMTNAETNEPIKETIEGPLIGSFFQKNETCDDEERYKCYRQSQKDDKIEVDQTDNNVTQTVETQTVLAQPKKNDTWLITPLPCLTSITESSQQKSMIDNDPLENLLIEQPTRFMSASTTEALPLTNTTKTPAKMNTPNKRQSKKQRVKKTYAEVMQLNPDDALFIQDLFTEEEVKVQEPATPVIVKRTTGEKRKEAEKSSPVSPVMNESPKKISRKSGKSLKTKASTQNQKTSLNKENMQVKTLLMAECFPKNDTQHKNTQNRYGQMLRANKNAALFSMAGNARQRKFHNLQQPSMTMQKTNQKI